MSVTTIVGKNSFMAHQALSDLKQQFIKKNGQSGLKELSAEDATYDDVAEGIFSIGLFSEATMLILRDISKNTHLQDKLTDQLENVPSESELVLYDPNIDKRSVFYKTLQKKTELIDAKPLDERAVGAWTKEHFKELGGELSLGDANLLAQRVNFDQWALKNELDKLINISQKPTRKLIEEVVDESFNETIFRLTDLAFSGQKQKAVELYREMLENRIDPHYVLSMLIWQLHIVLVAAWMSDGKSMDETAKEAKISPYVLKKSQGLARRTTKAELRAVVAAAAELDIGLKTGTQSQPDIAVELLLIKIAGE